MKFWARDARAGQVQPIRARWAVRRGFEGIFPSTAAAGRIQYVDFNGTVIWNGAPVPVAASRPQADCAAAPRSRVSFLLKATGRKVHVILTHEADVPTFVSQARTLGLDANVKNDLLQDSGDRTYDHDRLRLETLLALLDRLDRTGAANFDYRDRGRL